MAKHNDKNNEQLITNDMLDMKLDGISFSSKMKTKADNKHDYKSIEAMLELDYTGATLRDVIGWSFKDRRIAQQNVMRTLGQAYIESTPIVSVIAIEIKSAGVRVDASPEAVIEAGLKQGLTPEQIADAFLVKVQEAVARKADLAKQQASDEAELMDGVEVPNEQ